MITNAVDTYEIATMGQNLSNTFTLASNGILVDVVIDIIEVVVPPVSTGFAEPFYVDEEPKKKTFKRITVTAIINGNTFMDTALTDDLDVTIDDIEVVINRDQPKPSVSVIVKN